MNRGEVWWYELPDRSRRPGCILTRQAAIPVLTALLLAPATRTVRNIPTEVKMLPVSGR
jgi:mRNA interferase MazF